jgi:hypothetical protein
VLCYISGTDNRYFNHLAKIEKKMKSWFQFLNPDI